MKMWVDAPEIYLYRDAVDFRKSTNGLVLIVEQELGLSPFAGALYVFCNRGRDKLKLVYWDKTGFALWYKRLEKDKFKWPTQHPDATLGLSAEQWQWLLSGHAKCRCTPPFRSPKTAANRAFTPGGTGTQRR